MILYSYLIANTEPAALDILCKENVRLRTLA